MSEKPIFPDQDPRTELTNAAERAFEQLPWLDEAARVIGGPEATVPDVFPLPPEVRNEAPMPDWTDEQAAQVREIARRLGYGAEHDVHSSLSGAWCLLEGGKVWKIMAEAEALKGENRPRAIVFSGSPDRLLGDDERRFLSDKLQVELRDNTEYAAAGWLAQQMVIGKEAAEQVMLQFGYEVSEGNPFKRGQATGQLIHVGHTPEEQSVVVLRVDKELEGKQGVKPDAERRMTLLAEVLEAQGDKGRTPVVMVTSNTYASRKESVIMAGLEYERPFDISMYGRQTLRSLGAPVPPELPLNQLPGELRLKYDKLQELQVRLAA